MPARSQVTGSPTSTAGNDVQVLTTMLKDGTQRLVLIETSAKVLAVYHIDAEQGHIHLQSVRRIAWDLLLEEFNGQPPLPKDIRLLQP